VSANHSHAALEAVLDRMRCPRCGRAMSGAGDALCCATGHRYPWRDGYLDFGTEPNDEVTARTYESFGYEWTTFDRLNPEDEDFWRWYFRDVPLDELHDAVALDAGCGKGRYTRFTADHVAHMVALDGSGAVVAAAALLRDKANTVVVRSDLRAVPFADETFDFVTCLGVLHHLSDPEAGFRALTRLLAPNGRLFVYLYSRPSRFNLRALALRVATALRRVTTRLPHGLLRVLCAPLGFLLYVAFVVPGRVGEALRIPGLRSLPLHAYRRRPVRSLWLDTFDRLSAPVEHRYVLSDVEPWFERAGVRIESARDDAGLFILGRRTSASDDSPPVPQTTG
jgi:SAM-dependent methyltransferase